MVFWGVVSGHPCREPPADTFPIAGSIDTVEALVEDQVRSAHLPLSIESGLARRETVGAAIGGGGGGGAALGASGNGRRGQRALCVGVGRVSLRAQQRTR